MLPKPLYVTSGPHLSGYRVSLGYATLAEAQDAHEALARHPSAPDSGGSVAWRDCLNEVRDWLRFTVPIGTPLATAMLIKIDEALAHPPAQGGEEPCQDVADG